MTVKIRAAKKKLALVKFRVCRVASSKNVPATKHAGKALHGKGKANVFNLNQVLVVTTITDEDKKLAYKSGRFAEMGLKQAGLLS